MRRSHSALFCHNRAATKGAVNVNNAHPFNHGDYVGCHNGTLANTYNLKDHKKFEVDSENIYYNMAEEGHIETIKKLNGAFALCWYNAGLHTINLVRNNERPMYFCYSKDNKTIFWASESWMLRVATSRVGIEIGEVQFLESGKLMTINVPVVAGGLISEIKHTQEGVEFYKAPEFREGSVWKWYPRSNYKTNKEEKKGTQETQKTGTNIVPFKGTEVKNTLSARFLKKTITFSVVGQKVKGNLSYISCDIEGEEDSPELRVFTPVTHGLGKELIESTSLYQGVVKGCTVYGQEAYIVCDNRTITAIPFTEGLFSSSSDANNAEEDDEETFVNRKFTGFQGDKLSLQQYFDRTSFGCAECGDIATIKDADEIMWVGHRDYFCKDCKNGQFAAQYCALGN